MTTNDDIARRAYELWERAGRPEGKAQETWLQAETELKRQDSQRSLKTVAAQALLKTPKPRKVTSR
jgi:hypothetical protein